MMVAAAPPRLESPTTTATTAITSASSVNGGRLGSSGGLTVDMRKTGRRLSTGMVPEECAINTLSGRPHFQNDAQLAEFLTLLQPPTTPNSVHSRKKKVVSSVGVLRSFTNMFKRTGGGSKAESKQTEDRPRTLLALNPSQFPSVEANEVFQEIHRKKETNNNNNNHNNNANKALPVLTVTDLRGKPLTQKTLSQPSLEMNRSCATNPASVTQASTTNRTLQQWDSMHHGTSTSSAHMITGNSAHGSITLPPPTSVSARRNGTSDSVSLLSAGNERHHLHRSGSVTSRSRSHGPREPPPNLPVELETNSERAKRQRSEVNGLQVTTENKENSIESNPSIEEGEEEEEESKEEVTAEQQEDHLIDNDELNQRFLEKLLGANPLPFQPTAVEPRNDFSNNVDANKQKMCSPRSNRNEAPLYPSLNEFPPPPVFNEPRAEVEISPGFYLPLRGSRETLWAIQHGQIATTTCVCGLALHCVQDAAFVLCPECRVIGPMDYHGNSSSLPEGVGLGFKPEQLVEWKNKS